MHEKNNIDIFRTWLGFAAFIIIIAGIKAASSIVLLFFHAYWY